MSIAALFVSALVGFSGAQQLYCAGGYQEGAVVEKGSYWYLCQQGVLVPQGCVVNGQRLHVGDRASESRFQMQCMKTQEGYFQMEQVACIKDGNIVQPDQNFESGSTWFTCVRNGPFLQLRLGGCIIDNSHFSLRDKVHKQKQTLYECRQTGVSETELDPVGCLQNGVEHEIGSNFDDGTTNTVYSCSMNRGEPTLRAIGCVFNGQRYYDQQTYHNGDVIFRCNVHQNGTVEREPVGCVQNDPKLYKFVEKMANCLWIAGDTPYLYVWQCRLRDNTCRKEKIRCVYQMEGGYHVEVPPGCFRKMFNSNQAVGCQQNGEHDLQIQVFPQDRLDQAYAWNLKSC